MMIRLGIYHPLYLSTLGSAQGVLDTSSVWRWTFGGMDTPVDVDRFGGVWTPPLTFLDFWVFGHLICGLWTFWDHLVWTNVFGHFWTSLVFFYGVFTLAGLLLFVGLSRCFWLGLFTVSDCGLFDLVVFVVVGFFPFGVLFWRRLRCSTIEYYLS